MLISLFLIDDRIVVNYETFLFELHHKNKIKTCACYRCLKCIKIVFFFSKMKLREQRFVFIIVNLCSLSCCFTFQLISFPGLLVAVVKQWHRTTGRMRQLGPNAKSVMAQFSAQTTVASLEVQLPITSAPNVTETSS